MSIEQVIKLVGLSNMAYTFAEIDFQSIEHPRDKTILSVLVKIGVN